MFNDQYELLDNENNLATNSDRLNAFHRITDYSVDKLGSVLKLENRLQSKTTNEEITEFTEKMRGSIFSNNKNQVLLNDVGKFDIKDEKNKLLFNIYMELCGIPKNYLKEFSIDWKICQNKTFSSVTNINGMKFNFKNEKPAVNTKNKQTNDELVK